MNYALIFHYAFAVCILYSAQTVLPIPLAIRANTLTIKNMTDGPITVHLHVMQPPNPNTRLIELPIPSYGEVPVKPLLPRYILYFTVISGGIAYPVPLAQIQAITGAYTDSAIDKYIFINRDDMGEFFITPHKPTSI